VNEHLAAGESLYDLDVERLAALQPDLIVTQALCDVCAVAYPLVERVARDLASRPAILSMEPTSLAGVIAAVHELGAATGCVEGARALAARITDRIAAVQTAVAGARRKRTLLLEWTDPPFGGGHWAADLVERAGGEAVCAFPGVPSAVVSWDAIEAADPEVIVVGPCGTDLAGTLAALDELERTRPAWRAFAARRRVVALDGHHYVNRPGPSFAPTVELYAAAIHPELMPPPNPAAFRVAHAALAT
jgi:iron complex transport system substrate-binding protein